MEADAKVGKALVCLRAESSQLCLEPSQQEENLNEETSRVNKTHIFRFVNHGKF